MPESGRKYYVFFSALLSKLAAFRPVAPYAIWYNHIRTPPCVAIFSSSVVPDLVPVVVCCVTNIYQNIDIVYE